MKVQFIVPVQNKCHLKALSKTKKKVRWVLILFQCTVSLAKISGCVYLMGQRIVLQTCRLGKHRPLSKVSKDGLVQVGEEVESEKLEELNVDEWLNGQWAGQQHSDNISKLKLYAYALKQQLGEDKEDDYF